jgi:2-polyprenyl-3-methyl-5-hydroxy-6-metoxy-1,4-benzoquinol methylase
LKAASIGFLVMSSLSRKSSLILGVDQDSTYLAMDHTRRWETEREFFDNEEYDNSALPPSVVARYTECRKPWLSPEFPFYVLGDVRGKRILDVGCVDGGNSILLALKGAYVVGVDISSRAIDAARQRAALHGISERFTFLATPLELFVPPNGEKVDVVCGWAVLHHLIPVLDSMLSRMVDLAKPGGVVMFAEPIALWRWLRKLRLMLPIPTNGTPDERPLEAEELAILLKYVPNLQVQYHNALLRVVNRFFMRGRYEDMSTYWRALYDVAGRTDHFLLNRLGLRGIASQATLYGTVKS